MTTNNETDVGSNEMSETVQLTFRANKEDAEKWKNRVENMSGSFREILETWNEIEDKHNIDTDTQRINEIVLQTYINSLQKNITLLENEKNKLENKLEEVREEESEVFVKIDLGVEGKGFE